MQRREEENNEKENNESENPEYTEISLLSEDNSATIADTLENENAHFAANLSIGLGSGLGGAFGGIGVASAIGRTSYLMITAASSSAIAAMISGYSFAGFAKANKNNFQTIDYVQCGVVGAIAVFASAGTMTGGAAIITASNITNIGAQTGIVLGTSAVNTIATPVISLLCGLGIFKAREFFKPHNPENSIDTPRRFFR